MGWGAVAMAGLSLAKGGLDAYSSYQSGKAGARSALAGASASAAQQRAQGAQIAANARINAINHDALADYYLRAARNFQMMGRDERGKRGLQLGQDKGRIMTEAAGSGIDTTSKVVKKAVEDTVRSAYHDYEMSAYNEWQAAFGAMKQKATEEANAKNQRSIASWAEKAYNQLASETMAAGAIEAANYRRAGAMGAISGIFGGVLGAAGSLAASGGGGWKGSGGSDISYAQVGRDSAGIGVTETTPATIEQRSFGIDPTRQHVPAWMNVNYTA